MGKLLLVETLAILLFSLSVEARNNWPKVIYGEDDRLDSFQVRDQLISDLSHSTAAMVEINMLEPRQSGNEFVFSSKVSTLAKSPLRLCQDEPFADQPFLATCSGFLVAEDVLVTAGHCVSGRMNEACNKYQWVFDYKVEEGQDPMSMHFSKDNIYKCKEIIKSVYNPQASKLDFAIIKLDRPVKDRSPLKLRRSGKISDKSELVVMGYPWGLPLKIASGAKVADNSEEIYFTANLDTFQGNSGSAVFNATTGEVEGILVRGRTDAYIGNDDASGGVCRRVNHCKDDGKDCNTKDPTEEFEGVTRISQVLKFL